MISAYSPVVNLSWWIATLALRHPTGFYRAWVTRWFLRLIGIRREERARNAGGMSLDCQIIVERILQTL